MPTKISELMSFGALTVPPDKPLAEIVGRMRRIGHEGYPVVDENGQVIGLLTSRDMNRAAENGLEHLPVQDVMMAGQVMVSPDDTLNHLLTTMVQTGWGQVPVVRNDVLMGIVTRTDVIEHYAALGAESERVVLHSEVVDVLGGAVAGLIAFIAQQAAAQEYGIYMVGGVVRDLLLKRANFDVDFVLEGDAIAFAESLADRFGGKVETHDTFGTAKWVFDPQAAECIGQPLKALPAYIDLVTARHEFYQQPAVLPTVYNSGIRLDLRRRDFTINALAVALNGADASGTVIDLFGGLRDLDERLIRVLHSLSFADDPTRTLRAIRFSHRLGFEIEKRTAELIQKALPMMKRITGKRIANEITLLLQEPNPAVALLRLQDIGLLQAVEPAFLLEKDLLTHTFHAYEQAELPQPPDDEERFLWLLLATTMDATYVQRITARLLLDRAMADAMHAAAVLTEYPNDYFDGDPDEITFKLEQMPLEAALAVWVALPDYREPLTRYIREWRHIQPATNGHDLKALGLEPGPRFKVLLRKLRAARINGNVRNDDEERTYLRTLIESDD